LALVFSNDSWDCDVQESGHDLRVHKSRQLRRLWDTYRFPGFRPDATVVGVFGDAKARIIRLHRRGKKLRAARAAGSNVPGTTTRRDASAISPAATPTSIWTWTCAASGAEAAAR
jgi:hypothetical protein